MELTKILLSPVVTEKSSAKQAQRTYTFLVNPRSNKIQIAQAVGQAYGVKVVSVHVMPVQPKGRLAGRGRHITKRHAGKKALVTLGPKQILDVNKFSKK